MQDREYKQLGNSYDIIFKVGLWMLRFDLLLYIIFTTLNKNVDPIN